MRATAVALLLRLGTAAATLWDGCDWVQSNSNTAGEQTVGYAASPDDCIALVQAQCPTATIANIDDSGSGGCWCQYGYNPTPDSSGYMSCVLVTAAPTFTRAPTPAGYRDLDGDGVQDVAPEGECCISQYGIGFTTNSDSCGSTLAEVRAAGCCERPFVARYSLNVGGESTDSYDCVSFIGKAECESMYYIWSDVIGNCPHSASALKSDSAPASGPALLTTVLAAAAAAL